MNENNNRTGKQQENVGGEAGPSAFFKACRRAATASVLALLFLADLAAAGTNYHDPNSNNIAAARTSSKCSGFFSMTIDYEIKNEAMEANSYTIDWKTPPFKVTLVQPGDTRTASVSTYKSCPDKVGDVDWIDLAAADPGAVAPHRGTQTFPAPAQVPGWVILGFLADLLSFVEQAKGGAAFSSVYSANGVPVAAFENIARPVDPEHPDQDWEYTFRYVNLDSAAHSFTNTFYPWSDTPVAAHDTQEVTFTDGAPCGYGPGSVSLTDVGDVFPAAAIVPSGCPSEGDPTEGNALVGGSVLPLRPALASVVSPGLLVGMALAFSVLRSRRRSDDP